MHDLSFHAGTRLCICRTQNLASSALLAVHRAVGISGAASLTASSVTEAFVSATETAPSMVVAVATLDVFSDFPSGVRVESGDALDLLSADDSFYTSSIESE